MRILLVRTIAIEEDCSRQTYNNQGIGLATELTKLGHECGLVYYAGKGNARTEEIVSDGCSLKVYHIEGKSLIWNAIYDDRIYEIAAGYDIIQISECDQIASWLMYRHFPEKTIVYHGPYRSGYTMKYNARSFVFDLLLGKRGGFRKVPVITKSYMAEKYLKKKGFQKVKTLGVGLNPSVLDSGGGSFSEEVRKLSENKGDQKYLLYVGALSRRKNLKFILKIMRKLVKDKGCTHYHLIIVGGRAYQEDNYFNECFEQIRQWGLEGNVTYMGVVDQGTMKRIYQISDVFLLATRYDIFGMVYLEAMYYGLPIVTTLNGGSSLLIQNRETGYLCNLRNKEDWMKKIQHILEDEEETAHMREKGKALIRQQFVWAKLAPEFMAFYQKMMPQSPLKAAAGSGNEKKYHTD